jgi:hypothetical protein
LPANYWERLQLVGLDLTYTDPDAQREFFAVNTHLEIDEPNSEFRPLPPNSPGVKSFLAGKERAETEQEYQKPIEPPPTSYGDIVYQTDLAAAKLQAGLAAAKYSPYNR